MPALADHAAPALRDEEAAVYDRQLRVWGVEVQRKLTAARVLVVGFGQLAAEVAKNITLAGVGNLTLLDDTPAAQHLGANFLITAPVKDGASCAEAAAAALQAMNPLIKVGTAPGSAGDFCVTAAAAASPAAVLLQQHELVIAVGLPLVHAQQLDAACRAAGVKFMAAAAAGAAGWFFLDLQEHSFTPKDAMAPQLLHYPPMDAALSAPPGQLPASTHPLVCVLQACWAAEQRLQRPLTAGDQPQLQALLADALTAAPVAHAEAAQQLLAWLPQGEVAPVCAVLGGVIANNVVAAVSGASAPLHNLLCYSLADSRAVVERPPPAAGAVLAHAAGAAAAQQQHKQPPAAPSEVVAIDSD